MIQSQARPKVLFILGNHNHNTMLHQISMQLPECDRWYTPYYCDDWSPLDVLRRLGLLEFIALGNEFRAECLEYCARHDLRVDLGAKRNTYDLVVTCSDLLIPRNVMNTRIVGVMEGMIDPKAFWFKVRQVLPSLPRWAMSTTGTGLSCLYDRYCLASEGYIDEFAARGAPRHRLTVTGLPNFDNFAGHKKPNHWIEKYVLACTSDGRECLRPDDRPAFIRKALEIANGRPLVFKFHPNEKMARSIREVQEMAPGALYLTDSSRGSGEELAANCASLVTEWSTLAFFGVALGKETYSYRSHDELRRLLPLQHGQGAANIASVCREVLGMEPTVIGRAAAPPAELHATNGERRIRA
ncbi:MAG: hypothetical protein KF773_39000 [Deltaproteobacteria bacterium]|nr:hypothetical protein [Deltaproteobacteria bacterium]